MILGKYVIKNNGEPVIFDSEIQHNTHYTKQDVVSAGFFYCVKNKYKCSGKSTSLGVDSRDIDSEILTKYFGG
jgi:hypothetical protein